MSLLHLYLCLLYWSALLQFVSSFCDVAGGYCWDIYLPHGISQNLGASQLLPRDQACLADLLYGSDFQISLCYFKLDEDIVQYGSNPWYWRSNVTGGCESKTILRNTPHPFTWEQPNLGHKEKEDKGTGHKGRFLKFNQQSKDKD